MVRYCPVVCVVLCNMVRYCPVVCTQHKTARISRTSLNECLTLRLLYLLTEYLKTMMLIMTDLLTMQSSSCHSDCDKLLISTVSQLCCYWWCAYCQFLLFVLCGCVNYFKHLLVLIVKLMFVHSMLCVSDVKLGLKAKFLGLGIVQPWLWVFGLGFECSGLGINNKAISHAI